MKRLITLLLCLCMMLPLVAMLPFDALAADTDAKFTLKKTTFVQGEPIMVTPTGSGLDWIGIAKKGEVNGGGICWRYVGEGQGNATKYDERCVGLGNVAADIRTAYCPTSKNPIQNLPVGEYTVFWVPNNGYAHSHTYSQDITIIMGTDKTVYAYGEPIMVTALDTGSGKDWIGIAPKGKVSLGSARYKYITKDFADSRPASKGVGSGVAVDIRQGAISNGKDSIAHIPVGEWTVFWVENYGSAGSYKYSIDIIVGISTEKTTYTYGEPIMVTAQDSGTGKDEIAIIPTDDLLNNNAGGGSARYKRIAKDSKDSRPASVGMGNGVAVDIRTGAIPGGENGKLYADIPAGNWSIIWIPNAGAARSYKCRIDITVTDGPMKLDKLEYYVGDPIMVTAKMAGANTKSWCGIVPDVNGKPFCSYGTIAWYAPYNDPQNKNNAAENVTPIPVDIRARTGDGFGVMNAAYQSNCAAMMGCTVKSMLALPAGTYWMVYCTDSSGLNGGASVTHMIQITIKPILTVNKTEFAYGEPIMITPIGSGKDWVFITPKHADPAKNNTSIRWTYIDPNVGSGSDKGKGSGVAVDIRQATLASNYPDLGLIPPGAYSLYMVFDPYTGAGSADHATRIDIVVSGEAPDAPTDVTYNLTDKTTGLADGTVTVQIDPEKFANVSTMPTHALLYWGDANGPLANYTEIGYRPLTAATTTFTMIPGSVIPNEATHLWVAAYNGAGVSAAMFSVQLPTDRTYPTLGEEKLSFQIVSDVHSKSKTEGLVRIENFFNDVKLIDPDSAGIFVSGDITDTGSVAEYDNLFALWDKVLGSQSDVKIPFFPAVGNHEFKPDGTTNGYGDYATKKARFIEYLNKFLEAAGEEQIANGKHYYDLWIGEYHFIFLGSEVSGTNAYISDAQLKWLDETLAEDRKNGHPSFIMLHQCLYNTVSGGMPAHGWNGVVAGDENWEDWKSAIGANNAATNRTMKDTYEAPLRDILRKYPEAMMFSGHSHWDMSDINNMYNPYLPTDARNTLPNYLFNTGAVDYLAHAISGRSVSGSQGYYVYIFEDYIEFRGRDFANKKWIPNATYRIALDEFCVHENAADCAEACPDCDETLTPTATHKGEFDCSNTCKECGTTITPVKSHESNHACDATCKHCGEDVVTTTAQHAYDNNCDTSCNNCGDTRTVAPHAGAFDCSNTCKECGTAITPAKNHESNHACDATCKHCGADVVTTTANHAYDNDCDTGCNNCGDTRAVEPHKGQYKCSATCEECGTAITPEKNHESNHACDATCKYCHEEKVATTAQHAYDNGCDTGCNNCGDTRTVASHAGRFECSDTCQWCETPIAHKDHAGLIPCLSTTCQYGCQTPVTPAEHEGAYECSATCKRCDTPISHKEHTGAIPCLSTTCQYNCGSAVTPAAHAGEHPCSDRCKLCFSPMTHEEHKGKDACTSTTCQWCGAAVTPAPHTHGKWEKHNENQHKKTCTCGDTQYADHAWGSVIIVKTPTVHTTGEKAFVCADCGTAKTEIIAKLPATNVSDGSATEDNASGGTAETPANAQSELPKGAVAVIVVWSVAAVSCVGLVTCLVSGRKKRRF